MKKNIIILGPASSGKTLKAKEISKKYFKENTSWIDATNIKPSNPFIFSVCKKNTELLVFDNVKEPELFECLKITNPLIINKPLEFPFTINPKIIIVCEDGIKRNMLPNYFNENNFDFIELS